MTNHSLYGLSNECKFGIRGITLILEEFKKKIGRLVEGEVWDREYGEVSIDDATRESAQRYASRCRCSVRIAKGLFYTDHEKDIELKRLREIRLP